MRDWDNYDDMDEERALGRMMCKRAACADCGFEAQFVEFEDGCPDCDSREMPVEVEAKEPDTCACCGQEMPTGDPVERFGVYGFAEPGGNSALRADVPGNRRTLPCPDCGEPNRLTPADRARGYCCDTCADRKERGWD